jgi:hypothetical protein
VETRKNSGDGAIEVRLTGQSPGSESPQTSSLRRSLRILQGFALRWLSNPSKAKPEEKVTYSYRASGAQGTLRSWVARPGASRSRHLEERNLKPGQTRQGEFSFKAPKDPGDYSVRVEAMDGKGNQSVIESKLKVGMAEAPQECIDLKPRVIEELAKNWELDLGVGGEDWEGMQVNEGDEKIYDRWRQLGCKKWFSGILEH